MVIPFSALNDEKRYEAEFFRKRFLQEDAALVRLERPQLGSFANVTDGPHGYHVVDDASPIAMLTAKCASNWFADRVNADCIAKWIDDENSRSRLRNRDVILSTRGTVGMCALVVPEALPANLDQDVARVSWDDHSEFIPEFVVGYLNSRFGQDHMARYASGMVQQGLSLSKVRDIPIPRLGNKLQKAVSQCVNDALRTRNHAALNLTKAENEIIVAIGLRDWHPLEPVTYAAKASEAQSANRIDAEYFHPAKKAFLDRLRSLPGKPLGTHYHSVREMFDPKVANAGDFVRNFDLTDALHPVLDDDQPTMPAREVGSSKKRFAAGDVVISRLRAYLREIALVRTTPSVLAVGSSEFIVLRPRDAGKPTLSRSALLVFLRSHPVQTILKWSQDGSHHPRFGDEDLMCIPVPDAVCAVAPKVEKLFEEILTARGQARALLAQAKRGVEIAIETSEAAALKYLKES